MKSACRVATVLAAIGALGLLIAGCGGGFAPTLPSPDGPPPGALDTRFPLTNPSTEQPITGATRNQFTVEERPAGSTETPFASARVTRVVEETQQASSQYNVTLVLDRSGSMSGQKIIDMRDAATQFVDLMRDDDQVEIISFASSFRVDQAFTSNKDLLRSAISGISASGGTQAWDAAKKGLDDVIALSRSGRNAVMLMTDGVTGSDSITLTQLIADANAAAVPIFCVGFQAPTQAETELQQLASGTGALAWFPFDAASIAAAFGEFQQALQGGYEIFWISNFQPGERIDARITYNGPGGPIVIMRSNIAVPVPAP